MANKVRFGLKNVHVAFRLPDALGVPTWDTPIAIPGAIGFKPSAEGDSMKQFADNGPYFTATTNNGYTADLEMALIPDEVVAKMLNYITDDAGGLVEDADALPAAFALMFQVEGDVSARKTVYYECTAARPEREEKTKEASIAPGSDVLKLTIVPIEVAGVNTPKATLELSATNQTEYDAFFDAVYVPVITPEA